jgi:choline dehydrogenase-like flavoprotein
LAPDELYQLMCIGIRIHDCRTPDPDPLGTMPYDFDVIVIGSGAGGGTCAATCARQGRSVLLLERGSKYVSAERGQDEQATLIAKAPYDDRAVTVNGMPKRLYMGGIFGGGTSLYGAALMRPSREDFHPGKFYGDRIPRAVWDWPFDYDELAPFYAEAERLYGLSACSDDDFSPLERPGQGFTAAAIPIHAVNRRLMSANAARGLRPFRLPLAIDFARCLRCAACPGHVCPNGARRSSAQLVESAAKDAPLRVVTNAEVESLSVDGLDQVQGVCVRDRASGAVTNYRARRYVLAAGAIHSPALLLRSGARHPLIGRHYMYHLSPVVAGVFARGTGADEAFVKQVGFADYYFGTKDYGHKLGIVQSLPVPGPLMLAKAAPRPLPGGVLDFVRKRMLPLVGIVEDLPNPANRVTLGDDGRAEVRHVFAKYDLDRGRRLTRLMRGIVRAAGSLFSLSTLALSEEHVAHQCGTLRAGKSAAHAVVDRDCRMFDHPNLFVVDGSVLPTSLGVGPALTIMANALRVARVITRDL